MSTTTKLKNGPWITFRNRLALQAGVLLLCLSAANSPAQTYTVLHNFNGDDGAYPRGGLVMFGSTLYGTTGSGGSNDNGGTLFKVNVDGSDYAVLKSFGGAFDAEGSAPNSGLLLAGTTLYGTTWNGGSMYGCGTVFRVNTDGTGYRVLKTFIWSDGGCPQTRLAISDTTLYGTTSQGGASNCGTIFKLGTDGSNFTVLKHFTGTDGRAPDGALLVCGSTLYGTTPTGGSFGEGTIFKINSDGSGYSVLYNFSPLSSSSPWTNQDGARPQGGLVLDGATLYGTTENGGNAVGGTIFKINTDGSGFAVIKSLSWHDGFSPWGLILENKTLIGACMGSDYGNLFKLNTDGTGYTVLKVFYGQDGRSPNDDLLLVGSSVYGMTDAGGPSDKGVVFSLSIGPPTIITPPQSQTVEAGGSAEFSVDITNPYAATYSWLFDETNLFSCSMDCWLEFTNCDFSQLGSYTVVVTNIFGAVTSAPVMLNVIPAVERRPVLAINLIGEAGSSLNVEYAESLGPVPNWLPLDQVNLTNPPQYCFDITTPFPTQRFYRAWQSGSPSVAPWLSLPVLVPAITLTGNVGDSLRLDYINAIGPTDAWVTLDTVTLTHTSQLYFDTSSLGQPRRLYRIVPGP